MILVGGEDKDEMYERALIDLNILPKNVVVVDDRMIRGIAWGNHRGATTIWLQKGKFADELPTAETGEPAFIVRDILEVINLLS